MRETGVIISKDKNLAKILISKSEKCVGCTACNFFGDNSMAIEARNLIDANIGDTVDVEISPKQLIGHSLLIFLLPVLAMIIGYFLGINVGDRLGMSGEGGGILGAFVFLGLAFLFIKIYDTLWGQHEKSSADVVSFAELPTDQLNHHLATYSEDT